MRKTVFALLLAALMAVLSACGAGEEVTYVTEHEHVWGFWYNTRTEGEQVRYCKVCMAEQTQQLAQ